MTMYCVDHEPWISQIEYHAYHASSAMYHITWIMHHRSFAMDPPPQPPFQIYHAPACTIDTIDHTQMHHSPQTLHPCTMHHGSHIMHPWTLQFRSCNMDWILECRSCTMDLGMKIMHHGSWNEDHAARIRHHKSRVISHLLSLLARRGTGSQSNQQERCCRENLRQSENFAIAGSQGLIFLVSENSRLRNLQKWLQENSPTKP
jgi:hypothetical protein